MNICTVPYRSTQLILRPLGVFSRTAGQADCQSRDVHNIPTLQLPEDSAGTVAARDDEAQSHSSFASAASLVSAWAGTWFAVPKGKISPHRRGQKQQRLKPIFNLSQCGLCFRVMPINSVVSNCRDQKCPCGPPRPSKVTPAATATAEPTK